MRKQFSEEEERLYEYNHTRPSQNEEREALLKEMFAEIGEGVYLEPPFHANWAGHHVHMGKSLPGIKIYRRKRQDLLL